MLVEILVFGGEEGVDDELWNGLDRQIEPAFLGIFAEQCTVRGVHARHERRFIILQLRILRQVLGEMPDCARDAGDAHQEHHGSSGEQETQKPHQQPHDRSSVPTLAPSFSAAASRSKSWRSKSWRSKPQPTPTNRRCVGITIKGHAQSFANSEDPAVVFYTAAA